MEGTVLDVCGFPVRPQVHETNEFIRYCQIREKIEEKPFSINILTILKSVRKIGMVNRECRKNIEFLPGRPDFKSSNRDKWRIDNPLCQSIR